MTVSDRPLVQLDNGVKVLVCVLRVRVRGHA
ncbi:hypothetical protein Ae331Ps2_6382c [Pseudonocardia sp. Ae331_Ps2]|nr:hypothetical protein Ae331Ps2_6382c [Pseudonocardia sp. Ae331_Ps2]